MRFSAVEEDCGYGSTMEGALKSKQSRNIRIFDVVIAIFVAALTVFVVMQAIKLEALRYEIKLVKETKPKRHQGSLFKSEFL